MNSLHPFHFQELASIRVRGLHITHPSTQQNWVTKVDYEILMLFMNSQHPLHYPELASINVRGTHSMHSITQQKLVTKVDC